MAESKNPKCFVSYSWSSEKHVEWVINLAESLRSQGVDVILDKWDLKEGQDAIAFMEQMVTASDVNKVIMVCDSAYAAKADGRRGGVGTEAQIVSPKIYSQAKQTKFVAVVAEHDATGQPCVPTYYKGRIHIDLSSDDVYTQNFEQLLRWIFDQPLHIKPPLGQVPSFVEKGSADRAVGNIVSYKRAIEAVKGAKPNATGYVEEFLESWIGDLQKRRIKYSGHTFDDDVVTSLKELLHARNELIELFVNIARFSDGAVYQTVIQRFFESLMALMDPPDGMNQYHDVDFDNFVFLAHELFLYLIAALIKHERFETAQYLVEQPYFRSSSASGSDTTSFVSLRRHINTFDTRASRLKLNRASIRADLLKERCSGLPLNFRDLMGADFLLYLRSSFETINDPKNSRQWWPETLAYLEDYAPVLEVMARCASERYCQRVLSFIGVDDTSDFDDLFAALSAEKIFLPKWYYSALPIKQMINREKMGTRT